MSYKILVIDDEEDILELLSYNLSKAGYEVQVAEDGEKGIKRTKAFLPDMIIVDIMMPNLDGIETCRIIRETPMLSHVLVVFLTARSEEYSEIAAFDIGADDFITKPIKPRALLSRIAALFRRTRKEEEKTELQFHNLSIDSKSYTVQKGDEKPILLAKKEFELLYFLAKKKGRVFDRDELLRNVWGTDVYVIGRTVDVHIKKIREKIGKEYIITIKGVGYKFDEV